MKWATSCRSPVQNRSFPCDSSRQGNAVASTSFNHSFWTEFFAVYNFCWILGMIFLAQNTKEKCPLIEATLTIVLCQKNQLFLDSVRLLSQKLILVTGLTLPLLWVQIKVFLCFLLLVIFIDYMVATGLVQLLFIKLQYCLTIYRSIHKWNKIINYWVQLHQLALNFHN